MDIADNVEFRNRLVALAEVFDAKLSPQRQALYFEALRDIPFPQIALALNAALKACVFLPKPAELRKLALGEDEDHAEGAWLALHQAMRSAGAYASLATSDPALAETVVAMFGSWPEACRAEFSPEMWSSKRKEFGRIYRVFRGRQLAGARYLPGLCEQENAGHVEWLRYVPVAVIDGTELKRLTGAEAETYRTQLAARSGFSQLTEGQDPPDYKARAAGDE